MSGSCGCFGFFVYRLELGVAGNEELIAERRIDKICYQSF